MEAKPDPDIVSPGRAADAPQGRKRGKTAPAEPPMKTLAAREAEAVAAIERWLDGIPIAMADGTPMCTTDGKPIALIVLEVTATLRRLGGEA